MICPVCGEQLPCIHGRRSAALLEDDQTSSDVLPAPAEAPSDTAAREHNWRKEVASRVQLHRARRRKSGDTDATLEFDFDAEEALAVTEEPVTRERLKRHDALFRMMAADAAVPESEGSTVAPRRKIIRFPAQPVVAPGYPRIEWMPNAEVPQAQYEESPRIVEEVQAKEIPAQTDATAEFDPVEPLQPAEQLELLPSFDDIQLEPGHCRPNLATEVIPQAAPLQQRFFAAVVDVVVVILAAAIFDFTFARLAEDDPRSRMALLCGLVVSGTLWIMFQYLFLVHGRGTPGMRLAQLELATFEGKPVSVAACRCRALASTLSALSVGLGYAWALFDEDQLGWHDRITRTLLCSTNEPSGVRDEIWD